jgi:polynucleotide 5'-kinase involved in rRNA processing
VIIALEKNRELAPLIRAHRHFTIIRLPVSYRAATKSREARSAFREQAFRTYFQEAHETVLDLKRLNVQRCPLFQGRPLSDSRFLYAERTVDGIVAVSKTSSQMNLPGLQVLPAGFEKHLLCGLADGRDRGLGLGIIRAIDYRNATLTLLTPFPARQIKVLQFSELYLDFL